MAPALKSNDPRGASRVRLNGLSNSVNTFMFLYIRHSAVFRDALGSARSRTVVLAVLTAAVLPYSAVVGRSVTAEVQ